MKYIAGLAFLVVIGLHPVNAQQSDTVFDPEFMEFLGMIEQAPREEAGRKLDEFGQRLKISEAQQIAWLDFKNFVLAQIEQKQLRVSRFQERMRARNGKPLTSPEGLNLKITHLQQQLEDAQRALVIVENLYFTFDATQKSIFDQGMRHLWIKNQLKKRGL